MRKNLKLWVVGTPTSSLNCAVIAQSYCFGVFFFSFVLVDFLRWNLLNVFIIDCFSFIHTHNISSGNSINCNLTLYAAAKTSVFWSTLGFSSALVASHLSLKKALRALTTARWEKKKHQYFASKTECELFSNAIWDDFCVELRMEAKNPANLKLDFFSKRSHSFSK